jgi:hypothetical protein
MELNEALNIINENLESQEVKDFLQPHLDRHFSKSLDTWKQKTLPEIIKQNTAAEETPEQKRLKELQADLDRMKAEKEKADFISQVITYGASKGLPAELCRGLSVDNMETAKGLIDTLSGQIKSVIETERTYRAITPTPKGAQQPAQSFNLDHIANMSADEIYKNLPNLTK